MTAKALNYCSASDLCHGWISGREVIWGFDRLGQLADTVGELGGRARLTVREGIAGGWELLTDEEVRGLLNGHNEAANRAVAAAEVSFELPDGRLFEWVWCEA